MKYDLLEISRSGYGQDKYMVGKTEDNHVKLYKLMHGGYEYIATFRTEGWFKHFMIVSQGFPPSRLKQYKVNEHPCLDFWKYGGYDLKCYQCGVIINDDDTNWCGQDTTVCRECAFENNRGIEHEEQTN